MAEWVVLELTPQGEDEDPEVLRRSISRMIKGPKEIFIPASIITLGHSRSVYKLIENYVFIKRNLPDSIFFKLENTKYIASVLTVTDRYSRRIAPVYDKNIEQMKTQLRVETDQGIQVGDDVLIMSGAYNGITGKVIEEIPESEAVQVHISLRSKQALITLPRSFLRYVAKGVEDQQYNSPFLTKLTRIREWVRRATPFVGRVIEPITPIAEQHFLMSRLESWNVSLSDGLRLLRDPRSPSKFKGQDSLSLIEKNDRVQYMSSLIHRTGFLFYGPRSNPPSLQVLKDKSSTVQWLNDAIHKTESIQNSFEYIERAIPEWNQNMVHNLVFDGHNLAYRVVNALRNIPDPLSDSDGRPTSLIFGFLRSLAALKKRFEQANFYVVWDGSKQRRVNMYPEYKAGRPQHSDETYGEMERLRDMLPLFGVFQAHNPEEETDDLIACLLKNRLKGKHNLIVSTDRDFLQLVTYTDLLLVPKQGSRPEALYDPDKVVSEYGVPPRLMVHLRALVGDTSDNIPGVPRVPRKILASLLNAHGSIDGIYASSLAGTTPSQYEKIHNFEKQAHLNIELMALLSDLDCPVVEASPDYDAAFDALKQCSIQPDSLISAFFSHQTNSGFSKVG